MSRFGRSRVQDRAVDSDDIPVTKEPSAGRAPSAPDPATSFEATDAATNDLTASAAAMFANVNRTVPTYVDQKRVAPDAPGNDRAIDALRAATTAAGTHQPSVDDIERIRNLHAMTADAERRSRRVVSKPGARRRYQYAFAAETAALQLLGFATYDEFVALHGASATASDAASDETIVRIRALLTELGVDPLGDPLRAASDFLTAHESELLDGGLEATLRRGAAGAARADVVDTTPAARAATAATDWSKPIAPAPSEAVAVEADVAVPEVAELEVEVPEAAEPEVAELKLVQPRVIEPIHIVEPALGEPAAAEQAVAGAAADETATVEAMRVEPAPVAAAPATAASAAAVPAVTPKVEPEPEPEAPWVPAAHIPTTPAAATSTPTPPPTASPSRPAAEPADDVVDRWIHAEARAERMHAEVDRAQAELVAMLARSADLEQTVVTRVDELDLVNAELEQVQQRVGELERSIAASDAERADIDRALATSRGRVGELEALLAEREAARAVAAQQRAAALETVAGLEATLATRTAELVQARATVADLEAQLVAQAAHLDAARGEVGAARAASDALVAELEATKRSLDALDTHAEAIEAELADARRAAGSPETVRELEAVRVELSEARHELGHLELQRAETDRLLALDRIELQQLQHTLATTRDQAIDALDELTDVRRAVEDVRGQAEAAERARDAVTIDAADILARAEAEASNVIDAANRDAETIRQEAMYANGVAIDFNRGDFNRGDESAGGDDANVRELADQVERLERKLAKQRRRLDRLSVETARDARPKGAKLKPGDFRRVRREQDEAGAAALLADAEREAAEIRRAARRERERFRNELVGLLSRLAPLASEGTVDDDEDDDIAELDGFEDD